MLHKTMMASAAVLALGIGAITATGAFAQTTTTNSGSSLVEKLATKFNVNQAEVQAVFDADREAHHAQMQAAFETQLNQYVADGKITEAQKQLIVAKRAELEAAHKDQETVGRAMTPEAHQTARKSEMTALKDWATANGIDLQYLIPMGKGMRGHGGYHGFTTPVPAESTESQ